MTRRPRIVMTSFGFTEPGGGTLVPRTLAAELVRRGWDVTVFYAGTKGGRPGVRYDLVETEEQGIRLVGVFNRDHGLWDLGHPRREIDDPPITAAFAELLDRVQPDVVHFHNLHNLGAALLDEAAARGIRSFLTAHNLWLVDPRGYLLTEQGELSPGPGRGGATMPGEDPAGYEYRLRELRARASRAVTAILAPSESVRRTLAGAGYPEAAIDVLPQAMPAAEAVWDALGRDRAPGRAAPGGPLTVGFFGSVWPIKGVHLLVHAAQIADADVRVEIHGDIGEARFRRNLEALDTRGIVTFHGAFAHDELPERLARVDVAAMPSIVWETQGLMAAECLAGRVPALVPAMGGLAEQVRDGVDGLHFDGRDHDSLAARDRAPGERAGAARAPPGRHRGARDVRRPRRRARGSLPRRAARPRRGTRRRPSRAPCAGSATTTSTPASRSSTRRSSGGCAATRACASSASSAPA